ncbi:MAG TPA: TRAP transporter substrate-binding protein [Acetobacteraceae bacterium]|jgi:tripartite ATP-independent transporter DctP family solute receptor
MFQRRTLIATTLAAPAILRATRAGAAQWSYKFANNQPATHPLNIRAQEAVERIKAETGGRMEIQIFPSNQLGSDTDVLNQLRSGAVEFFTLSGLILATLVPAASINGIGFAFPDYESVWKAMDGELGGFIRGQIAKANLIAFDRIFDNGFRHMTTSTKPIRTPADLQDLKLRVPVSPLWTSMFKAFGASPISINATEIYSALQTRIADAQENPLVTIYVNRIHEVQKYCSLTGHMWDGFWFLANRRAFEALPEDVRTITAKHMNAAAVAEREDVAALGADMQGTLEKAGLQFNAVETAPFREKLRSAGFYAEWKAKYGPEAWAILERATGRSF